jgi:DNA polymerase-3 subunit delta'
VSTPPLPPWLGAPFEDALRTARGHALLLHGPRGVGQFELALALAGAWLCEAEPASRPGGRACGECAACRLVAARTHPDLAVLLPEALQASLGWGEEDAAGEAESGKAGRKPSREIRVEAIRAVIAFAQQTATRGGVKVAVLYPAERVNATAANMLLKTLEEPPGRMRFILASAAAQRLLPTVRSRCQAIAVPTPPAPLAEAWLAEQGIGEAGVLLAAAGGQPLEVAERLALGLTAEAWRRLPREVRAGEPATLAAWPLPQAIDALQTLCHDAVAAAVGAPPRYFPTAAVPGDGDLAALTAFGQSLRQAARHAEHPLNASLAVESWVQQMRRAWGAPKTVVAAGAFDTLGR